MSEIQPPNGKVGIWWRITHLQPVLYRSAIISTFALLAALGITTRTELPDAVVGFVLVFAAIIQAAWIRDGVMPTSKVVSYLPEPVDRPADIRAGTAVTSAEGDQIIEAATISGP